MNSICLHCDEPVTEAEQKIGQKTTLVAQTGNERRWMHRECMLRSTLGSVRHQLGTCSCPHHGDNSNNDDPPGMTKRQEAIEACRLYELKHNVLLRDSLNDEAENERRVPLFD